MRWMYDAANPPPDPPHWHVCAGYIGGDTPHVWSIEEWDAQWAPARLPIFTRTNAPDTAEAARADSAEILAKLRELGVPKGSTIAVDTETVIYHAYLKTLSADLAAAGHPLMNYGSLSYVIQNATTSGGRWAADWDENIFAALEIAMQDSFPAFQYEPGDLYDKSVIEGSVPLWHRAYAG
jgi:hypothetical protein